MENGILGGGIAGLTLSQLLGENSVLLEKEDRVGGLARSIKHDKYTFDQGSHIIFSRNEAVLDWMIDQLGTNIQKNKRKTRIYLNDNLVKYPFENDLHSLPKQTRYECVIGYIEALKQKERGEVEISNFEDWILSTFGSGIAEHYMFPYNRKVWCMEPRNMSAHWVEGRIPMPPAEDIVKSAMGIPTEGYTHQLNFYYPKFGGIEGFAQAIANNSNGSILTNQEVQSVASSNDGWRITTEDEKYEVDELYNTLPIYLMPKLMDMPDKVEQAIYNLQSNGAWLVMVGIEGPSPDYSWMYFADKEILFNRISFPKNFSSHTSPDGYHSILVEITCNVGDDVWNMDPELLKQKTVEQLRATGMVEDGRNIDLVETAKTPLAYVVYDLDYQHNISFVNSYFDKIGVTNVGRFAEFLYYNMDGVINSALEKVKPVLLEQ